MEKIYVKLRNPDNSIWDPTQKGDTKKIMGKQVAHVERTDRIDNAIIHKALVEVDEDEHKKYLSNLKSLEKSAKSESAKGKIADERLKIADQKLKDIESTQKELADREAALAKKETELADREAALAKASK